MQYTWPTLPVPLAAACAAVFAATMPAQQEATGASDRSAIAWVLPGDFDKALARAQRDQRILVVKGISFGVDTEGARCATKGVW